MNSQWARFVAFYRRLPASTSPLLLIVLGVFIGNGLYLIGESTQNPIWWTTNLTTVVCHVTCGRPMIDPNVGFISQPLGHLAALDLLHLHLPWWNYFEGLGQPLAGEMQSAALFPLTLLFALPSGLLWFHLSIEIIAGASMYFLAKRLGIPTVFAACAGVLFALNGTFAWIGNAVLNPVCFLPMLLLGIEMIYSSAGSATRRGWYVAAIAIALSLYAGFPEVAYFDGLFCIGWAAVRLFSIPREERRTALARLGIGGGVGLVLALPILVPFADFMKVANIGHHVATVDGSTRISVNALQMFFDPYFHGTIFSNVNVDSIWGNIGGYFLASVGALALLGLFATHLRPLRIFLLLWTILGLLGAFDFLGIRQIWNLIPLVQNASFGRYIMASCEMSVIVLAALGLMDLATSAQAKRLLTVTSGAMLLGLIWIVIAGAKLNHGVVLLHKARYIFMVLDAAPFVAVMALLILGRFTSAKFTPLLVALVLAGESMMMFVVPSGEAAKFVTVDTAPITFLQTHEGQYRYFDFAVLSPNWPTQFNINSLNAIDLPIPRSYSNYIEDRLYPGLTPSNQFVIHNGLDGMIAQEDEIAAHFHSYEAASVKYLMLPVSVPISPALTNLGVEKVFADAKADIYQMPNPRPFFSTSRSDCSVASTNVNAVNVNCVSAGTTLIRTELAMAGWSAYVNGRAVPITTSHGVYEAITLPKGQSVVTYKFFPPHEKYALLAGLLAAIFLVGSWLAERGYVHRRRTAADRV